MRSHFACLIALCFGSLAVHSFAELSISREGPLRGGHFSKLTCMTTDNRAALVWNHRLARSHQPNGSFPIPLRSTPECAIAKINGCSSMWKTMENWTLLDSVEDPMEPVFDDRWEEFEDLHYLKRYVRDVPQSGTVAFSARGLGDIVIQLCEGKTPSGTSCFRIIIPALPNKRFIIRSCSPGGIEVGASPQDSCYGKGNEHPQSAIVETEWRTFTLTWDGDYTGIKVHGDNGSELTKQFQKSRNIGHMFVQGSGPGRIRFHFYKYLSTRTQDAKLYSHPSTYKSRNFCIELLLSLCPECYVEVSVFDSHNKSQRVGRISGNGVPAHGELSTWRLQRLEASLDKLDDLRLTIEITTKLNQNSEQRWWAVDSFQECKPQGHMKTLTYREPAPLPMIGCQQLLYNKNAVVLSNGSITQYISNNEPDCDPGTVLRPACKFQCTDGSCKGSSVCDAYGCICSPGFKGSDCETECPEGHYGHNCQKICECENFQTCDRITGSCFSHCEDYYLPPKCETKLQAPVVFWVTATTVILPYPELNWNEIPEFDIKTKTEWSAWKTVNFFKVTLPTTPPRYGIRIRDLSPVTLYKIKFLVSSGTEMSVESPEGSFTTSCQGPDEPLDVEVTPTGDSTVVLKWKYVMLRKWIEFKIYVQFRKTRLRDDDSLKFTILRSLRESWLRLSIYSAEIDLPISTQCHIFVQARNSCGYSKPAYTMYQLPARLGFAKEEILKVERGATFMKVKLPPVINDTWDTTLTVVVKGSPSCESPVVPINPKMRKLAKMTESGKGWIAAEFVDPKTRPEYLTIGRTSNDDNSKDCTLLSEETYIIAIVVVDRVDKTAAVITSSPIQPVPEVSEKLNLALLLVPSILLVCFILLIVWHREFAKSLCRLTRRNIISYSQTFVNFVKTATTCDSGLQEPPLNPDVEMSGIVSTPRVFSWNRYSHSVNVGDFEDYVKESIASSLLKTQFLMFPKGLNKSHKYGSLPENSWKNRYSDIIAYDHTRVILKKTPDDPHSDYINANYIQGLRNKRAYIATQGPKPQTVIDFWRMVWQEEALVICMLANIVEAKKTKCEQYWPEIGEAKTYGEIVIVTENQEVFADYTFTSLRVSCRKESRKIEHLHYTEWPDHAVPTYSNSIVAYLRRLQTVSTAKEPMVVHCSAGIGRTGTIILCDICIKQAATKGVSSKIARDVVDLQKSIDVLAAFKKLRDCRLNMVDNYLQYLFVHVVLTEYLISLLPTGLKCNNDLPRGIEEMKKKLPQHMKRLSDSAWQEEALRSEASLGPPLPEQLAKNRFPELAPASSDQLVNLQWYPKYERNSDYISAVMVDGPRVKKQYLASQLPLPTTLSDFWRLIAEQKVELVIILQKPDSNDPTCCDILPNGGPFDPVLFISVESKTSANPKKSRIIEELLLRDTSKVMERTQRVTVLTCPGWGLGKDGKPPAPKKLVQLWKASGNICREQGPTVVLCHDGVTGCGLFLALSFLLERMAVERECDIISAVRAIRRSRPEFVRSEEQFKYLYDAAAANYAEFFGKYANFNRVIVRSRYEPERYNMKESTRLADHPEHVEPFPL